MKKVRFEQKKRDHKWPIGGDLDRGDKKIQAAWVLMFLAIFGLMLFLAGPLIP
jgi:hypothetical protein